VSENRTGEVTVSGADQCTGEVTVSGADQCAGEVTVSGADQSDSHDRTAISFSENDPLKSVTTNQSNRFVFDCMTATLTVMAATKKHAFYV
jgi:hypothetical protein